MRRVITTNIHRIMAIANQVNLINRDHKYIYDLGCGEMKIKEYINFPSEYIGIDIEPINKNVLKYDFNSMIDLFRFQKILLGNRNQRLAIASGVLEYLSDPLFLV